MEPSIGPIVIDDSHGAAPAFKVQYCSFHPVQCLQPLQPPKNRPPTAFVTFQYVPTGVILMINVDPNDIKIGGGDIGRNRGAICNLQKSSPVEKFEMMV
ncbi:unnamed protein product [Ambrosiozyma monospora]|uniref:Unnamed protein product n=1 Tax=Ambrosiozyma monospora TaxID=43982 RepID=A0ACB5T2Y7_AMBMO|nr:unnamed protein product [Ambrosiozyma monospora]